MSEQEQDVSLLTISLKGVKHVPLLNGMLRRHQLPFISYWAILVGDKCYELTHSQFDEGKYDVFIRPYGEWVALMPQARRSPEKRSLLGSTAWPDSKIAECARGLWVTVFDKTYHPQTSNCQEFAFCLLSCILRTPKGALASLTLDVPKLAKKLAKMKGFLCILPKSTVEKMKQCLWAAAFLAAFALVAWYLYLTFLAKRGHDGKNILKRAADFVSYWRSMMGYPPAKQLKSGTRNLPKRIKRRYEKLCKAKRQ